MTVRIRTSGGAVTVTGLTAPYARLLVRAICESNRHRRATPRMVAHDVRLWWQMHGGASVG